MVIASQDLSRILSSLRCGGEKVVAQKTLHYQVTYLDNDLCHGTSLSVLSCMMLTQGSDSEDALDECIFLRYPDWSTCFHVSTRSRLTKAPGNYVHRGAMILSLDIISCMLSSTLYSRSDRRAARRPNQGALTCTTLPLRLATTMQDVHVESREGFSYLMLVDSMVINCMSLSIHPYTLLIQPG